VSFKFFSRLGNNPGIPGIRRYQTQYYGIYSAAISVRQDIELRRFIRKSALKEAGLLNNIASAEMEQQITKKSIVQQLGQSVVDDNNNNAIQFV
jgi:hypothetical protein